jgi:hypothetical protein
VSEVFIQRELDQKEKDIERFNADYLIAGDAAAPARSGPG